VTPLPVPSEIFPHFHALFTQMPRNARVIAPGLPYHITQRGTNRQRVFFTTADRSLYLRLIRENLEDSGTRILAYCLMTNHVHFVVIPSREDSLALLFGRANGRYAQALNIRKGRSGHLWQARFHSCPMSNSHFWVGLRYVEANPCRANMVTSPADYPWSSASVHLNGGPDRTSILDLGFWERAGGAPAWVDLHSRDLSPDHIRDLRKCTYAGRPFGEQSFVEEMEVRFQRKWLRKSMAASG
jgi:putative transposase